LCRQGPYETINNAIDGQLEPSLTVNGCAVQVFVLNNPIRHNWILQPVVVAAVVRVLRLRRPPTVL
jgi:hypothetical protein